MLTNLLSWIYNLITGAIGSCVTAICKIILNAATFSVTGDGSLVDAFPILANVYKTLQTVGLVLSCIIFLYSLLMIVAAPLSQVEDSPLQLLPRFVGAIVCLYGGNYLLVAVVNLVYKVYDAVFKTSASADTIGDTLLSGASSVVTSILTGTAVAQAALGLLLGLIMSIIIARYAFKILKNVMVHWLWMILIIYTSPLAWPFMVSHKTSDIFRKWLNLFFGECFSFLLSTFGMKLVFSCFDMSEGSNALLGMLWACFLCEAAMKMDEWLGKIGVSAMNVQGGRGGISSLMNDAKNVFRNVQNAAAVWSGGTGISGWDNFRQNATENTAEERGAAKAQSKAASGFGVNHLGSEDLRGKNAFDSVANAFKTKNGVRQFGNRFTGNDKKGMATVVAGASKLSKEFDGSEAAKKQFKNAAVGALKSGQVNASDVLEAAKKNGWAIDDQDIKEAMGENLYDEDAKRAATDPNYKPIFDHSGDYDNLDDASLQKEFKKDVAAYQQKVKDADGDPEKQDALRNELMSRYGLSYEDANEVIDNPQADVLADKADYDKAKEHAKNNEEGWFTEHKNRPDMDVSAINDDGVMVAAVDNRDGTVSDVAVAVDDQGNFESAVEPETPNETGTDAARNDSAADSGGFSQDTSADSAGSESQSQAPDYTDGRDTHDTTATEGSYGPMAGQNAPDTNNGSGPQAPDYVDEHDAHDATAAEGNYGPMAGQNAPDVDTGANNGYSPEEPVTHGQSAESQPDMSGADIGAGRASVQADTSFGEGSRTPTSAEAAWRRDTAQALRDEGIDPNSSFGQKAMSGSISVADAKGLQNDSRGRELRDEYQSNGGVVSNQMASKYAQDGLTRDEIQAVGSGDLTYHEALGEAQKRSIAADQETLNRVQSAGRDRNEILTRNGVNPATYDSSASFDEVAPAVPQAEVSSIQAVIDSNNYRAAALEQEAREIRDSVPAGERMNANDYARMQNLIIEASETRSAVLSDKDQACTQLHLNAEERRQVFDHGKPLTQAYADSRSADRQRYESCANAAQVESDLAEKYNTTPKDLRDKGIGVAYTNQQEAKKAAAVDRQERLNEINRQRRRKGGN